MFEAEKQDHGEQLVLERPRPRSALALHPGAVENNGLSTDVGENLVHARGPAR